MITAYFIYEQQHCSKVSQFNKKNSQQPLDSEMESSNLCKYPEEDFKLRNTLTRGCFNKGLSSGFKLGRILSAC